MNHTRRKALLTTMAVLFAWTTTPSAAGPYPDRAIRLVVPFPPGGGNDATARIIAAKLMELLGQQVVVENRAGASGIIGSESVARAAPDGYVLLMASNSTHAINPALYSKLSYDPVKDFEPVGLVALTPNLLILHPSVPADSVAELIALAKRNDSRLSYGSAGSGTTQHLAGELFKAMAGVDILHVPYKGAGPAMADLLGGQVSMAFDALPSALPHVLAGRLKALGITSPTRSTRLPQTPTIAETLPGYEVGIWFGVFAPRNTPASVTQKVNQAINQALAAGDVQERLKTAGLEGLGGSAQALAERLRVELPKWRKVVEQSGARVD